MVYRKLLVPLGDSSCGRAAVETALAAVQIWGAQFAALIVQVDSRDVAPLAGEGLSGAMIEDMMSATERDSTARAARLRAMLDKARAGSGLADDIFSIETMRGRDEDIVPAMARLADLTVLPHPDRAEDEAASDTLHAVLFDSGRPVLIAPRAASASLGTRCCVAWNGTAESAAALTAILPWLERAQAVRVLHAGAYQRRGPGAAEVVSYLALHSVVAEVVEFSPVDRDVGAGLLRAAADFGADLLGMGGYSHSRLRQLILGGVTRHVLENSTLPVLMSR